MQGLFGCRILDWEFFGKCDMKKTGLNPRSMGMQMNG